MVIDLNGETGPRQDKCQLPPAVAPLQSTPMTLCVIKGTGSVG